MIRQLIFVFLLFGAMLSIALLATSTIVALAPIWGNGAIYISGTAALIVVVGFIYVGQFLYAPPHSSNGRDGIVK
jgi:hypothetical protein